MKHEFKNVYAALFVKQIPFTIFKENDNDVFKFKGNKLVLTNHNMTINDVEYFDVKQVIEFIQHV